MGKKRVLFIDDEAVLLKLFERMLTSADGYEVLTEQEGKRALQTARSFKPDIIFMDINMPDVDGPAIVGSMRSDPGLSKVPVVFLTGAVSEEEVQESGGSIGGEFFLAKPLTQQQLVRCIEEHLK